MVVYYWKLKEFLKTMIIVSSAFLPMKGHKLFHSPNNGSRQSLHRGGVSNMRHSWQLYLIIANVFSERLLQISTGSGIPHLLGGCLRAVEKPHAQRIYNLKMFLVSFVVTGEICSPWYNRLVLRPFEGSLSSQSLVWVREMVWSRGPFCEAMWCVVLSTWDLQVEQLALWQMCQVAWSGTLIHFSFEFVWEKTQICF